MDVLTDVLEAVHLKGTVLGRLELTAPWGLQSEGGCSSLLVVTRGTCWLDVKGVHEPLQLAGGDLVLLTGSKGHTLRDNRRTRAVPFAEVCRAPTATRVVLPARRHLSPRRRGRVDDDHRGPIRRGRLPIRSA